MQAAGYDTLVGEIDKAFDAAQAKTPHHDRPLLKRDQAWFNEIILSAARTQCLNPTITTSGPSFTETLRQRVTTLEAIGNRFGRPDYAAVGSTPSAAWS